MDYQTSHNPSHPASANQHQYPGNAARIRTSLGCAVFTHIVLFMTIFLAFIYVFNWPSPVAAAKESYKFQWHPVLMISAFVLFMGEALLAYRLMPFEHDTQKKIHLILQTFALIAMCVSIWMIITFHTVNNGAHIYNAHGITGIATFSLFCVQYVIGVIAFFFPKLPDGPRASVMPCQTTTTTITTADTNDSRMREGSGSGMELGFSLASRCCLFLSSLRSQVHRHVPLPDGLDGDVEWSHGSRAHSIQGRR